MASIYKSLEIMQRKNCEMYKFIDELFESKSKLPPQLYHYTTMEVLFNYILKKTGTKDKGGDIELIKRYGENAFYASLMFPTLRHTNDEKEISKGIELYNDITKSKHNPIPANGYENDFKNNSYSFSLSETCDSLAMWMRYGGGDAKGVCIEFDTELLDVFCKEDGKTHFFDKCVYVDCNNLYYDDLVIDKKNEFIQPLRQIWESKEKSSSCDTMTFQKFLSKFCPRIKNSDYIDEKEWRIVYVPESYGGSIKEMQYMVKNNKIVPYILVSLPIDAIKRVIVGPNQNSKEVADSLELFIKRNRLEIGVEPSKISYRM